MRRLLILTLSTLFLTALLASPAAAQTTDDEEGVLVRVNGDVIVPSGDAHGVVVVVDGNLDFQGTATTVVVVNGDANLTGATITTLVVVSGVANLGPQTTVTGDVQLVDSDLSQDATATVEGTIDDGVGSEVFKGFWVIGLLFMIGWAVLILVAGLLFAAIAPDLARGAGRTITTDLGPTILAGLVLWIAAPIVGGLLFATIIGAPTAFAIWLFVLPVLGFAGLLVAGVRVGEYITAGGAGIGHPYLAAAVGLAALVVVGAVPFIGPAVVAIAGFLGSGSLALHAARAIRRQPMPTAPPAKASTAT